MGWVGGGREEKPFSGWTVRQRTRREIGRPLRMKKEEETTSPLTPHPPTHPPIHILQDVQVNANLAARMQPILNNFTATHKVPGSVVLMAR